MKMQDYLLGSWQTRSQKRTSSTRAGGRRRRRKRTYIPPVGNPCLHSLAPPCHVCADSLIRACNEFLILKTAVLLCCCVISHTGEGSSFHACSNCLQSILDVTVDFTDCVPYARSSCTLSGVFLSLHFQAALFFGALMFVTQIIPKHFFRTSRATS